MTNRCLCLRARRARARHRKDRAAAPHAASEHVLADYQTIRLSLKGYPTQFLRPRFDAEGITSCERVGRLADGASVRCAGVVLVRQRPGEGKAIFITLSDETGVCNVVVWARMFEQFRKEVDGRAPAAGGRQGAKKSRRGGASDGGTADRPQRRSCAFLRARICLPFAPVHRHPRNVRVLPASPRFSLIRV